MAVLDMPVGGTADPVRRREAELGSVAGNSSALGIKQFF
jgi:hypothetical protein